MSKKVILLMVEGITDEDALALVFSKIAKEHELEFDVLRTDITAKDDITVKYIDEIIKKEVDLYFKKNPFIEKEDILKIVQIIDTDGAFISSSQIKQSTNDKTEYYDNYIGAKNKDRLIRRNISKRKIVYHLSRISELPDSFPYEIYYFSRNLEHVLHNISKDLTDDEKEDLAFEVADQYSEKPMEFLRFLKEGEFAIGGSYEESWDFIMKNGNSLKRYSNVALFFQRLGIELDDEYATEANK